MSINILYDDNVTVPPQPWQNYKCNNLNIWGTLLTDGVAPLPGQVLTANGPPTNSGITWMNSLSGQYTFRTNSVAITGNTTTSDLGNKLSSGGSTYLSYLSGVFTHTLSTPYTYLFIWTVSFTGNSVATLQGVYNGVAQTATQAVGGYVQATPPTSGSTNITLQLLQTMNMNDTISFGVSFAPNSGVNIPIGESVLLALAI
jgi:hypothetical protein